MRSADGSGAATVLTPKPGGWPNTVSPDGKFLVFHTIGIFPSLMLQPIDPIGPARLIVKGPALNAEFSPDGRWLAYESSETGRTDVYVQPFPAIDTGRWQVSLNGGRQPVWSPSGRELFYVSQENVLTAVPLESGASFVAGKPVALFPAGQYTPGSTGGIRNYGVSADGKRFLVTKRPAGSATITVVTNWFDEVRRKVDGRPSTSD
jgi:hypothetical protein